MHRLRAYTSVACWAALAAFAVAEIDIGTTDASDGDLTGTNPTLDMSLATNAAWNAPSAIQGRGVYDATKWAVVYKFNNVDINGLTILPHKSGCPIVILAQGNVTIRGQINVPVRAGGFHGGYPSTGGLYGSCGLGPGAGQVAADGFFFASSSPSYGSYGRTLDAPSWRIGSLYGNRSILPLVGGSGGGAFGSLLWGGWGGGAVLFVCRRQMDIGGELRANGESAGDRAAPGSGGAIKIIADVLSASTGANLQAVGGTASYSTGGLGRIRLEANRFDPSFVCSPDASMATVGPVAKLWPDQQDPAVTILDVNGQTAPADPANQPWQVPDIQLSASGNLIVRVLAMNIPTDGSWTVKVVGTPRNGLSNHVACTFQSGNQAMSVWSGVVPMPDGMHVLQAIARKN